MSNRAGYSYDSTPLENGRWRGWVASAIRGKRGQRFLTELITALDAMPNKRLIAGALEHEGQVCALGALGKARGIDLNKLHPADGDAIAAAFDIAEPLAREVAFTNDEGCFGDDTPEGRFNYMRRWAQSNLKKAKP